MKRLFGPLLILTAAMFAYAPVAIQNAPYESTMGLVQKIFYFHVPSWFVMFSAAGVCGIAGAVFLFTGRKGADRVAFAAAELAVVFGLMGLITGPLWGRKAWGVWWQWDARLTSALVMWLVFVAYLLLRKYGGAGSEKLSAVLALFGMANVPFIYVSVTYWRTIHPATTVVPKLPFSMGFPLMFCLASFYFLMFLLMKLRVRVAEQQARLDAIYLSMDEEA